MVSQPLSKPLRPAYAPRKPHGFSETNWLPTLQWQKYQLTFRFYGPSRSFVEGTRPET